MITSILVAMDDSEYAAQTLEFALENHPQAEVTVIHVVGVPSMLMGEAVSLALESDVRAAAEERARPIFERAREIAAAHDRQIHTEVGLGHPARNVLDRADAFDAVFVGAHGKHSDDVPRRILVGNIAETVARRAPVPVMIVR